jgi:hypothetical protein
MADAPRRFPPPWRADKIPGDYVVRDANGRRARTYPTKAFQAKTLTAARAGD